LEILSYSYRESSYNQYISQPTHSAIHYLDRYQLLHVSALRCHPQGVITTKLHKLTWQLRCAPLCRND